MTTDGPPTDVSETARFPFPASPVPYDPGPEIRGLIRKCPASKVRLPDDSLAWLAVGFREVREVLTDRRYSRALLYAQDQPRYGIELVTNGLITMDPPEHSRLRKLVAGAFSDKRIQALRPRVAAIVDDLIDAMLAGPRPADLVHSFSNVLPISVICLLLGVPVRDIDKLREWSNTMFGGWNRSAEAVNEAYTEMNDYMAELIAQRRQTPKDDLIDVLIDARDSDGKLTEDELVGFCRSLVAAGHETTSSMISLSFVALCQHPVELARLRADPGLIPAAVEELLRYVYILDSTAIAFARVTREEVSLGGVTIPAGDRVFPFPLSSGRDPAAFDDPDRLDVGRAPRTHLAFGAGVHRCLGAQLARVELQEAFRGLLTRLPCPRMTIPMSELEFREGQLIASMRELPVTWDDA